MASRYKNGIADVQDLVDIIDGFLVLKFGHDTYVWVLAEIAQLFSFLLHDLFKLEHLLMTMVDRVDHIVDVILQDEANVFSQSIVVFSYINLLILHEGPSCRVLITTIIIVLSALIWLLLNICIRIVSRGN